MQFKPIFGFRNKKCNDFLIIPNNCRFTRLDKFKDNSYSLMCSDPVEFKCNQSFYSYVEDISNLICIPLPPEEIINECIHYTKYPYDDFGFICMECGKEFYLSNNECIKIQKKK